MLPQAIAADDALPRPAFLLASCRSAVSGRGVTELVRAVRARLDALPAEEESEDDLVDRTQQGGAPLPLPGRRDAAVKIGEFTIEADLSGPRVWLVQVRGAKGG